MSRVGVENEAEPPAFAQAGGEVRAIVFTSSHRNLRVRVGKFEAAFLRFERLNGACSKRTGVPGLSLCGRKKFYTSRLFICAKTIGQKGSICGASN